MKKIFPILLFTSFLLCNTKTVAISYFDNTSGIEQYNPLSKGLADMLITDLSNVQSIQIVEREKLESLLNEIKLGESKFFDPATAQKLGKGLGADIILTGAFLSIDPDMRIDARLIDVGTGKIIKANKVLGKSADFFLLESQLVDQLVSDLDIKLSKKPPKPKQEIKLDAVVDYSKSIDLSDKGFDEEARKILESTVEKNPDFIYASDRFSKLKQRIEELDKQRKIKLQESIRNIKENLDFGSKTFGSDLNQVWISLMTSMSYSKMLVFNEYLDSLKIDTDLKLWDSSPITIGEMLHYYNLLAYSMFKKHDMILESGEKFLVKYPTSSYYAGVKNFLETSMEELEKRKKGKNEAPEKIKHAEIRFYLGIINRFIEIRDNLSNNDYQQAKDLYKKWVMQIPIENLKGVVYNNKKQRWAYSYGVPNFLNVAKLFKDYNFSSQIIEIHRELLVGTEKEEKFYILEDKYFDILDQRDTFDSFYAGVNNRKSFLMNPNSEEKHKWSAKLDSLEKAGFDSLLIIAGEKYLVLGPEKEYRDPYGGRNRLWSKILDAAERKNNFVLWKELLDRYSNDLHLSEYNSKNHRQDIRQRNKKYRGALREYEDDWKHFNEFKSKKYLLKVYAQIYMENFQHADEISIRLKILSEFDLSDEEAVREYGQILNKYVELGKFDNAIKILDIIEKKYNNFDYSFWKQAFPNK